MGLDALLISALAGSVSAFGFYAYHRPPPGSGDGGGDRRAGRAAVCRAVEGGAVAVGATVSAAVMIMLWAFPARDDGDGGSGYPRPPAVGGGSAPHPPDPPRSDPAREWWACRNSYRYRPRFPS
jgi:hypothetical protein